jgi:hypothetical protein
MIQSLTSNDCQPCILVDLTLATGVIYIWSGVGMLPYNGHNYGGVGSLGSIGDVTESIDVKADGTTLELSGIDPILMNDCLNDIQLGAPVTIWLATLSDDGILGTPTPLFVGTVDKPAIPIQPDKLTLTLNLENRMINLQRASNRRYTAADQNYYYPDDSGMCHVESGNDVALVWGQ